VTIYLNIVLIFSIAGVMMSLSTIFSSIYIGKLLLMFFNSSLLCVSNLNSASDSKTWLACLASINPSTRRHLLKILVLLFFVSNIQPNICQSTFNIFLNYQTPHIFLSFPSFLFILVNGRECIQFKSWPYVKSVVLLVISSIA